MWELLFVLVFPLSLAVIVWLAERQLMKLRAAGNAIEEEMPRLPTWIPVANPDTSIMIAVST